MGVRTSIVITHGNEALQTAKDLLLKPASKPRDATTYIRRFFEALGIGNRQGSFTVQVDNNNDVAGSGTFTFSAHATAGDTVLVNGVTFTGVASGPTTNQFVVGTTATQTATNLAAAIAASATALVTGVATATSLAGVVTVSAVTAGLAGNSITIAKGTDSGSVNTVSGARLTGGTAATGASALNTYHCGA